MPANEAPTLVFLVRMDYPTSVASTSRLLGVRLFHFVAARLLVFALFLHIDFIAIAVDELVFEEGKALVWDDLQRAAVVELPATAQGDETLIDVGSDEGMHVKSELLDA